MANFLIYPEENHLTSSQKTNRLIEDTIGNEFADEHAIRALSDAHKIKINIHTHNSMVSVSPQGLKQANALRTFDIGLHALHYYPMVPKKKIQNSVSFADQSVKPKTQELLKQKSVSLTLAEQYVKHKNQEPLKQRTKNNKNKKKN